MRETEQIEIDGQKYACTMMPVQTANQVFLGITATLGRPLVDALVSATEDGSVDAKVAIAAALARVADKLSGQVSNHLIESVFDGVHAEGIGELKAWSPEFDDLYRGRLASMYKVFTWSIKVNFADFLDVAHGLGVTKEKAMGLKAELFKNPPTSTDSSGMSSTVKA